VAGARNERVEDLFFQPLSGEPTEEGQVRFVDGDLRAFLDGVVQSLVTGSGITASGHSSLLQLIHFIDEGPAEGFTTGATKTVTGTVFPSQVLWRRADSTKLVEQNITWTGANATTVEWKIYAADGTTVLATITDTITYSGPFEASRVRAIA